MYPHAFNKLFKTSCRVQRTHWGSEKLTVNTLPVNTYPVTISPVYTSAVTVDGSTAMEIGDNRCCLDVMVIVCVAKWSVVLVIQAVIWSRL